MSRLHRRSGAVPNHGQAHRPLGPPCSSSRWEGGRTVAGEQVRVRGAWDYHLTALLAAAAGENIHPKTSLAAWTQGSEALSASPHRDRPTSATDRSTLLLQRRSAAASPHPRTHVSATKIGWEVLGLELEGRAYIHVSNVACSSTRLIKGVPQRYDVVLRRLIMV